MASEGTYGAPHVCLVTSHIQYLNFEYILFFEWTRMPTPVECYFDVIPVALLCHTCSGQMPFLSIAITIRCTIFLFQSLPLLFAALFMFAETSSSEHCHSRLLCHSAHPCLQQMTLPVIATAICCAIHVCSKWLFQPLPQPFAVPFKFAANDSSKHCHSRLLRQSWFLTLEKVYKEGRNSIAMNCQLDFLEFNWNLFNRIPRIIQFRPNDDFSSLPPSVHHHRC